LNIFEKRKKQVNVRKNQQRCPHCGSNNIEKTGIFGPFHMSAQYHCLECSSPFSIIKWKEDER
tara:strand:+ start:378 stop:566 length:189 start_codon:yes stop_codon:yes gene_type:complete